MSNSLRRMAAISRLARSRAPKVTTAQAHEQARRILSANRDQGWNDGWIDNRKKPHE